eukprot:Transcript_24654.p1 GENE.Transcript_24654~~Transcript_24654.p1  ORF type:complete len:358 (-),score=83.35 Transcript_24654:384-1457(-)
MVAQSYAAPEPLTDFDAQYTSCAKPASCGKWDGSELLGAADASRPGPVPLLQLIGTRKGGTTALSDHLLKHPYLLAPDCHTHKTEWPRVARSMMCVWDKEVRYFSRGFRKAGEAAAGARLGSVDLCWYRSLYPCVPEGAPHVGFDGSPDYLTMPEEKVAAMRLAVGAQARLVALLRNPADRFYSAYNMGMNEALGRGAGGAGGGRRRKRNRRELLMRGAARRGGARARRGRELSEAGGAAAGPEQLTYQGFAAALPRYLQCAPECREETGPVGEAPPSAHASPRPMAPSYTPGAPSRLAKSPLPPSSGPGPTLGVDVLRLRHVRRAPQEVSATLRAGADARAALRGARAALRLCPCT